MSVMDSTSKIIITSFMSWFSHITVMKYGDAISTDSELVYIARKVIPVPIQWCAREKWLEVYRSSSARKAMDPAIRDKNPIEMQWILPRISVSMNGIMYDQARKLIKTQTVPKFTGDNKLEATKQYTPSPFNFDLEVTVITKTLDDNLQIMEQIIPYFSPEMSINVKLVPGMDSESVPIVLNGITNDIPVDLSETEERLFTFSYNFTVKTNLYPKKKYSNTKQIIGSGASGNNVLVITGDPEILGIIPGTAISGFGVPTGTIILEVIDPSTLILSNNLTSDLINSPLLVTGGNVISSSDFICNYEMISNIISVPCSATSYMVPGMLVWGLGIPPNTYIETINSTDPCSVTITNYTTSGASGEQLHFGTNKPIQHVQSNLYMGKDYIQIDQTWIDYLQKIEETFNQYEASASVPNPFL